MQFPVSIELHRSFFLSSLLYLLHAFVAGCVYALPWHAILRALFLIPVFLSLWQSSCTPRIIGLRLLGQDTLDGLLDDGRRVELAVLPDSTVFPRLIVLRLLVSEEKRRSSIVLLPDQMSDAQFRVLRLWLRWRAGSMKNL